MSDSYSTDSTSPFAKIINLQKNKRYWLHIGLFILTFITTTFAGVEWTTGNFGPYSLDTLLIGLPYSLSILFADVRDLSLSFFVCWMVRASNYRNEHDPNRAVRWRAYCLHNVW